nr:GNAT family N-acetyltransferase [Providencia stuartii]
MVTLVKLDKNNWEDCADLQVSETQSQFIASNLYSIAEVQFLPNFTVKGIQHEEVLIGLVMYGIDPDDGNYWIYRFMIDKNYQRLGYGRQAMALVIDEIKLSNQDKIPTMMIGYHTNNLEAHLFYQSVGFEFQGLADWGEYLAKFDLLK